MAVIRGARRALERAELLFLEIHPERLEELRCRQEDIFDYLSAGGWLLFGQMGEAVKRAQFADRIHTFWVICRKGNGDA